MKEYKIVYQCHGVTMECGQNGWVPSKEIAEKIMETFLSKPYNKDYEVTILEREAKNQNLIACRSYNGKTVINPDWLYVDALRVGDYVEETVVDNFINCLPPACMRLDCSQLGEEYDSRYDANHILRPTYLTFKRIGTTNEGNIWEYCGKCFRGQNVEPNFS